VTVGIDRTAQRVLEGGGQAVLVFSGPDSTDATLEKLRGVVAAVASENIDGIELFGPWFSPRGSFILADIADDVPRTWRRDWILRFRDLLIQQGVDAGTLTALRAEWPLTNLEELPNHVQVMMFSAPGEPVPSSWARRLAQTIAWTDEVTLILGTGGPLRVEIGSADVDAVLSACLSTGTDAHIMTSGLTDVVRALSVFDGRVVVSVGGPSVDVVSGIEALAAARRVIADTPDVVYATLVIEPDWMSLHDGWFSAPELPSPVQQAHNLGPFIDKVVLDGFHWQLLSSGHAARHEDLPTRAVRTRNGCWELIVGTPDDWRPDHPWPGRDGWTPNSPPPNTAIRNQARNLLDGLVLRTDDMGYLTLSHFRASE
jgi:hypothetical protein